MSGISMNHSAGQAAARPILRAATVEDAEAIAELWHQGWRDGHLGHVPPALLPHRDLADFRRRVPDRLAQTTVALVGGWLAGFVTVQDDEVEQVYVAAQARGSGTADALLEHAERVIAERFGTAWLAVVSGNARARRFYERNGWRDTGAFDYRAEVEAGTFPVPCHRYEKRVR